MVKSEADVEGLNTSQSASGPTPLKPKKTQPTTNPDVIVEAQYSDEESLVHGVQNISLKGKGISVFSSLSHALKDLIV